MKMSMCLYSIAAELNRSLKEPFCLDFAVYEHVYMDTEYKLEQTKPGESSPSMYKHVMLMRLCIDDDTLLFYTNEDAKMT